MLAWIFPSPASFSAHGPSEHCDHRTGRLGNVWASLRMAAALRSCAAHGACARAREWCVRVPLARPCVYGVCWLPAPPNAVGAPSRNGSIGASVQRHCQAIADGRRAWQDGNLVIGGPTASATAAAACSASRFCPSRRLCAACAAERSCQIYV